MSDGAEKGFDAAGPEQRLKSVPPDVSNLSAHGGTGFSLWGSFSPVSRVRAPQRYKLLREYRYELRSRNAKFACVS
jgi:hypothetical protein